LISPSGAVTRDAAMTSHDARKSCSAIPRVSVVVPTCGRPALLQRCLAAVAAQHLDSKDFEVVVVDDRPGRDPATEQAVRRLEEAPGGHPSFRYLVNPGPHGPAAARNLGWRAARASIIAFTDDDTQPEPDWLGAGLQAMDSRLAAVTGRIVVPLPAAPTDYERDAGGLARAEFATANCFCRKSTLLQVGGFDERFRLAWREDSDLQFRIMEAGGLIGHSAQAVVVHPVRPAGWGVSLRQQRKVMYDALLFRNHPRLYRARIRSGARWDYYATVAALVAAVAAAALSQPWLSLFCLALWFTLTLRFCAYRLRGTARTPAHVAEMLLTSALIPPVALFWRLVGAVRFRTAFV
jgi:GT2 family glycosyltransferase